MEKSDLTKMERWEVSRKQGKKFSKSKKFKESQPLTEEQLEKLPNLPKDWKWVFHSEIAIINPPKPNGDESLEISFLPMPAVEEETGRYSLSETRKLGEVRKGYTGFIEGDVIFAKITPCMENGKVAYLEKLVNGIGFGSTEFHVSRPTSSVFGKYLFHYLVRQTFRKEAKRNMTGSAGQLRVPSSYFAEQPFPLAPLPEQRAIVSKIEQLFSELDNGIANLKLAQKQLKVYRQAVLKKAFEGELTKKWREQQTDLPYVGGLLEQIKKEREEAATDSGKKLKKIKSLTKDELTKLTKLPDEWKWVKLDEICNKITDGEHVTPKRTESGYLLLSARNIQNGYLDLKSVDYVPKHEYLRIRNRCNPEEGDILISCSGSVGRICSVPKNSEFVMVRSVALVKISSKLKLNRFFEYQLQSPLLQSQIEKGKKATAQANLFLGPISNLKVIICSLPEQRAIVQEIETRFSVCDKIEQDIEMNLEKAEALRQSILKKAFEGKLLNEKELAEVRGTENWEPAEVLLERIKAEKAKNRKK
ncbi:restriction endonuclease subunit S [Methanosarcina barkeri]|uniref:Type I restriction-modification system, specificity subunit S n=1 Tax=Methanosarcina barkeri 227 TaxID=1434106 RepID=A0A0E3R4Y9_METBA|nr:restriction endonuclease subunit S [Methanosarcina barkeri]AKB58523.1 Type I restriction-modification system, specificity subunit S [Methanosarcina barkeri 227]